MENPDWPKIFQNFLSVIPDFGDSRIQDLYESSIFGGSVLLPIASGQHYADLSPEEKDPLVFIEKRIQTMRLSVRGVSLKQSIE